MLPLCPLSSCFSLLRAPEMEHAKAIGSVSSPSETPPSSEAGSQLSTVLYDVSQQVQIGVQNMLKMTGDIDQSAGEIMEDLEKCKESAGLKNKILEGEKERFQKAAIAVLEMLNGSGVM